ncbi:MAP/microtubule affinity-regulating kinase 3 [Astathelohania contejeani]|uniref:non-specific serine/threonine protein kinase n=1 Tax=Astathelohania contejeani TaxID=164912 RepID=A0ABQ7I0K3_9MICR|nr:MAP/microtubule affinity-regulating kinase 3 [Thelohania contejeani]
MHEYSRQIRDYIHITCIGKSKMCTVTSAYHVPTNEPVALKQIDFSLVPPSFFDEFIREQRDRSLQGHPNIIKPLAVFTDGPLLYIVYKLMELGCCRSLFGHIGESECKGIICNVIRILGYMTTREHSHRNINSSNILFDINEGIFLTGCCRPSLDSFRGIGGEPVNTGEKYNQRFDVWGIGILIFELMFGVSNTAKIRKAFIRGDCYKEINKVYPHSPELYDAISFCLHTKGDVSFYDVLHRRWFDNTANPFNSFKMDSRLNALVNERRRVPNVVAYTAKLEGLRINNNENQEDNNSNESDKYDSNEYSNEYNNEDENDRYIRHRNITNVLAELDTNIERSNKIRLRMKELYEDEIRMMLDINEETSVPCKKGRFILSHNFPLMPQYIRNQSIKNELVSLMKAISIQEQQLKILFRIVDQYESSDIAEYNYQTDELLSAYQHLNETLDDILNKKH